MLPMHTVPPVAGIVSQYRAGHGGPPSQKTRECLAWWSLLFSGFATGMEFVVTESAPVKGKHNQKWTEQKVGALPLQENQGF